jgi:hypothetical protein
VEDEKKGQQTMWLLDEARQKSEPYTSNDFHVDSIKTSRGETIAAMWIGSPGSTTTILFSHGNATDIGLMRDHLLHLSAELNVNVCESQQLLTQLPCAIHSRRDLWCRRLRLVRVRPQHGQAHRGQLPRRH